MFSQVPEPNPVAQVEGPECHRPRPGWAESTLVWAKSFCFGRRGHGYKMLQVSKKCRKLYDNIWQQVPTSSEFREDPSSSAANCWSKAPLRQCQSSAGSKWSSPWSPGRFLSLSQDDLHVKPKKRVMLILPIRQSGSAFGQSRLNLHAIGRLITPFYASFVHGCQAQVDDIWCIETTPCI